MPEIKSPWPQGCRLLLTRDNAQGRFLAQACALGMPNLQIVVEGTSKGSLQKIRSQLARHRRRKGWGYALGKILELPFLAVWEWACNRRIHRELPAPLGFPVGVPLQRVPSINSTACVELVKSLAPQSSMVYGTSILKSEIIEALGKVANVHMGIVPQYRGAKSEFWALTRHDEYKIGFSLHELVLKLDAGALLHQEYITIVDKSPTHCRILSLRRLAENLPDLWRNFEIGVLKAKEQKGDVGYFSTPSLMDRLKLALRTGYWT